jgi:TPR repeat protein
MSTKANEEKGTGEDIYQQALQLMKEADDLDEKKEEDRSNMMYEAYQKSKEKELNPKLQGVKVVKTLVKQVRKDRTENNGSGDKRNEALELLRQAIKHHHPDAAILLGNLQLKRASRILNNKGKQDGGSDAKDSVVDAMDLFRLAGKFGSRVGWYNLGHLLWTGWPSRGDTEGKSEEQDSSDGVAEEIEDDTRIVVADMEEAMNAFGKAIELGDSDAMYLVGAHWLAQNDFESNVIGFDLIERAADAGHHGALLYVALFVSTFVLVGRYTYWEY